MIKEGINQPDPQSQGVYNSASGQVLFLHLSQVYMYSKDAEAIDSIVIHWSRKKVEGPADDEDPMVSPEDYNNSAMIYSGIKGQELGFLNITNKEIEFYDIKTGFLTKKLVLPQTTVTESTFNFSFANGIYWLFNMALRKWVGYK